MMNSLNVAHDAHKIHVISAHTIHEVVGWLALLHFHCTQFAHATSC